MAIHLNAALAQAYWRGAVWAKLQLLVRFQKRIQKKNGRYQPVTLAKNTLNFGSIILDRELVRIFAETCERTGGVEWLKPRIVRSGSHQVLAPTKTAERAIETYRKRRGFKFHAKDMIIRR